MAKYMKRPVVIEAVQYDPNVKPYPDGVIDLPEDIRTKAIANGLEAEYRDLKWIATLEHGHTVAPGDWIITGVKGERYPCKPDIFAATYEPVVD